MTVICISECVNRCNSLRYHPGETMEVDHSEYQRLLNAKCIQALPEAAAIIPPNNMARIEPKMRRRGA
jgi:hypothetical protein